MVPCDGHSRFCQSCAVPTELPIWQQDVLSASKVADNNNRGYAHFFVNARINHDLHMCVNNVSDFIIPDRIADYCNDLERRFR